MLQELAPSLQPLRFPTPPHSPSGFRSLPAKQAPPDPGMAPRRCTHERRGPSDLHLTAPDAVPSAIPGHGHPDRPRQRAHPLNPLDPHYAWYPVSGRQGCCCC